MMKHSIKLHWAVSEADFRYVLWLEMCSSPAPLGNDLKLGRIHYHILYISGCVRDCYKDS